MQGRGSERTASLRLYQTRRSDICYVPDVVTAMDAVVASLNVTVPPVTAPSVVISSMAATDNPSAPSAPAAPAAPSSPSAGAV